MTNEEALRSARQGPDRGDAEDLNSEPHGHSAQRGYLTIEEAAAYLNVSIRFMRRIVCDRRMRHYKIGKFVRLDPADLDAFAKVKEPAAGSSAALATEVWRVSRGLDR